MTCSKVLPTFWNMLFDCHIGISKTNQAHFVAFLGRHSELFTAIRVPPRLVVALENLTSDADRHGPGLMRPPSLPG